MYTSYCVIFRLNSFLFHFPHRGHNTFSRLLITVMGHVWILMQLIAVAGAQLPEPDPCEKHISSCSECITDPDVCDWCATEKINGTRCRSRSLYTSDWCLDLLQNPNNTIDVIENLDFNSNLGKITQIKPQKYNINLRPGLPVDFKFSFKTASDYPVDLYFILDSSYTMSKVKDMIEEQSMMIYETLNKLSKNILLGIGTFVDKNTLPYTDVVNKEMTYSFRNRLKLTNNSETFKNIVKNIPFGSNFDEPEGGLDALAQTLSCKTQIGWRPESRKIVLFLTDDVYHVAGDGIIGGIFQPYDGGCYTNDDGVYTKELEMDYPSVSMINQLAADEEVTIIFIVKREKIQFYSHLSEFISGSKYTAYGEDQITKILSDLYEEISTLSTTIKLKLNMANRNKFSIKFDPDCTGDENKADCAVKRGQEKVFTGTIKLLEHYADSASIDVRIEGIKEKVTLDVGVMNDCDCGTKAILKSPECSNAGTLKCGICECDKAAYGGKCACQSNSNLHVSDNSTCIAKGDVELCSGQGSCICGKCICSKDSPYEGNYCQFNKNNCPRYNNVVCNGHGKCRNEKCFCADSDWTGSACECFTGASNCMGTNGKVCNGMGVCQCGSCACENTAQWDARESRDVHCALLPCPDCHKPQCDALEACARCLHSGGNCPDCELLKATLSESPLSPNSSWSMCPDMRVDVGCYTRYMYHYTTAEYGIELVVQADKNCLESYYMFGGIFLASLILIGIATLVAWKWLTDARDRKEYERFLKEYEADLTEPCDNEIYHPASTTINNPAFRKPSVDFQN